MASGSLDATQSSSILSVCMSYVYRVLTTNVSAECLHSCLHSCCRLSSRFFQSCWPIRLHAILDTIWQQFDRSTRLFAIPTFSSLCSLSWEIYALRRSFILCTRIKCIINIVASIDAKASISAKPRKNSSRIIRKINIYKFASYSEYAWEKNSTSMLNVAIV